jgi:dihydrolipoamide dehydrogenase
MIKTDLIIIGGGPAGYVGAIRASQLGAKVCLVEKENLGGTCLNIGCIPTKALLSYAESIYGLKTPKHGLYIESYNVNNEEIYGFKSNVITKLRSGIESLLKSYGVEVVKGKASFLSENKVLVSNSQENQTGKASTKTEDGGTTVEFDKAIISTGSVSVMPKSLFVEGFTVDSNYVLENSNPARKISIVGGGVIGCELAFILNSLGSEVTIIEKLSGILTTEDKDCVRPIETALKKKGIRVITGTAVEKIEAGKIILATGELIESEKCILAIGRKPNIEGLNLNNANVKIGEKGEIEVDDKFQTSASSIYAVGDVVGGIQLAHYASATASRVVETLYSKKQNLPILSAIPRVIYSIPELASVGTTETQAKEQKLEYKVGRFAYAASGKAMAMDETEGMIKVIADSNDKIIGTTIVGKDADNLIVPFTMAIALGLTATDLCKVVYPHPTLSEIILEACEDLHGKAIHKPGRRNR